MSEIEERVMRKWKGKSGPILKAIFWAQIGGKACTTVKHLPVVIYDRLPRASQTIAALCVALETALAAYDLCDCERVVVALTRQLSEIDGVPPETSRDAFVTFGGDALLLQILFCPFELETHPSKEEIINISRIWDLQKDCLEILRELCCSVPFFAESMAMHREYLVQCFALMGNDGAFDSAVSLAEEILSVRDQILDLREVHNFTILVPNLSARQLLLFCRILAMVVFEPEAPRVVTGGPSNEVETERSTADLNHEIILTIPNILPRLVKLLHHYKLPRPTWGRTSTGTLLRRDYVSVDRAGNGAEYHIAENSLLNTRSLAENGNNRIVGDAAAMNDAEVDSSLIDNVDIAALSLGTPELFNLSNQVEILFVLSALCGSSKRDQVQNTLSELGLVEILSHMFDKLDWAASLESVKPGVHGQGCVCNVKWAFKIQYLRLIHNFCDRDSCNKANKHLLLEPTLPLYRDINSSSDQFRVSDGLMIRIVKVLIREPADSIFRFWLASCVEAFLRGADVKDQEIVASTGLMEHLLAEILKGGFSCASSLQINFDLLGEIIKFNHILFSRFSRLLSGNKFERFVEALVMNLVDSNVFIRSVLLSLETFRNCWQAPCKNHEKLRQMHLPQSSTVQLGHGGKFFHGSYPHNEEWCQIGSFIIHNKLRLLRDLLSVMPHAAVNQDNICVLNTALVVFILADHNGVLQMYLQALRIGENSIGTRGQHMLQKFRQLLYMWQRYYLRKNGRDSLSLQYSTGIPFTEWLRVVKLLCKESGPASINCPLSEPDMCSSCMI